MVCLLVVCGCLIIIHPLLNGVRYPEFDGFGIAHNLIKPTVGWDTNFEIIYVEGSLAVLVIDDSGSMGFAPAAMPLAISAAKQYVDLMEFGENVAVVGFDGSARIDMAITELKDQADKELVKAAIDGLITHEVSTNSTLGWYQT